MNNQVYTNLELLKHTSYLYAYKGFDKEPFIDDNQHIETKNNDVAVNIVSLLKGFYALQMLEATSSIDETLHSHIRWQSDFKQMRQWYYTTLAQMIYDYSVLACFGEMRHGRQKCHYYLQNTYFNEHAHNSRKEFVSVRGIPFTAESIIKVAKQMFTYGWANCYGGDAWYNIAKAQDLYIKGQEPIYIDHCVDLEHNGGCYFNKEMIFTLAGESMHDYLNTKYTGDPNTVFELCPIREIQDLILRANTLGIITPLNSLFYFEPVIGSKCRTVELFYNMQHRFFGDNESKYNEWSIMDFMRNYHPYEFGHELLSTHNFIESNCRDESGERIYNDDDYRRRRDA